MDINIKVGKKTLIWLAAFLLIGIASGYSYTNTGFRASWFATDDGTFNTSTGTVNVANATGTLSKSVMPANVSYNNSIVGIASVKKSTTQNNIVNGVWTLVSFDVENYDPNNEFATNNYTAPLSGYYQISASLYITDSAINIAHRSRIYINGATSAFLSSFNNMQATLDDTTITTNGMIKLNQGDVVGLYYYTGNTGNTDDIYNGEGTFMTISLVRRG